MASKGTGSAVGNVHDDHGRKVEVAATPGRVHLIISERGTTTMVPFSGARLGAFARLFAAAHLRADGEPPATGTRELSVPVTAEELAREMYDAGTAEVERLFPGMGGMTPVSWDEVVAAWPGSHAMWLAAARAAIRRLRGQPAAEAPPAVCGQCQDGLVEAKGCNCGSAADEASGFRHEPFCGYEPCPNGCWEVRRLIGVRESVKRDA